MSDAGDDIPVDPPVEVEVPAEAPKGKLSVEDALQVILHTFFAPRLCISNAAYL